MKGFTLIELVVVFALIGILTSVSVTTYTVYNTTQSIQVASADVVNILSTAKSRAISQVKPTQCAGKSLTAYQVAITIPGPGYVLNVLCGGSTYLVSSKELPPNMSFSAGSATIVNFAVSTGITSVPATVSITGHGRTKTITIQTTGNIVTN